MKNTRLLALAAVIVVAAAVLAIQTRPALAVNGPGTSCAVFPAGNVWNSDISGMPVHSQSAAWLASTGATGGRLLHPDFGGPPYGIPFNVVSNTHATTNFTFQYASESDPGLYPYGSDLLIEQGSDAHLLSINQNTCKLSRPLRPTTTVPAQPAREPSSTSAQTRCVQTLGRRPMRRGSQSFPSTSPSKPPEPAL